MAKVIVEFPDIDSNEVEKVRDMIVDGLFDLCYGSFFEDKCKEKGIENFDSVNWDIKTEE